MAKRLEEPRSVRLKKSVKPRKNEKRREAPVRVFRSLFLLPFVVLLPAPAGWTAELPGMAAGFDGAVEEFHPPSVKAEATFYFRLHVPYEAFDPEALARALRALRERGMEPVVVFARSGCPAPEGVETLEAWELFLRDAADAAARHGVRLFEVGVGGGGPHEKTACAHLYKRSVVVLRSAVPGAGVVLNVSRRAASEAEWLEALYAYEMAAYVDGVATEDAQSVAPLRAALDRLDPKAHVWLVGQGAGDGEEALKIWLRAIKDGASLVTFADPGGAGEEAPESLTRAASLLSKDYVVVSPAFDRHRVESTEPDARPVHVAFYNAEDNSYLVAFFPENPAHGEADASVHAVFPHLEDVKRMDIVRDEEEFLRFVISLPKENAAEILTHFRPYPLFMSYRFKRAPGFGDLHEEVEVTRRIEMPVEEIIARHQVFDRRERAKLRHYSASGRIDMHFRIAEFRSSIDIATENQFYFSEDTGTEWEQREVYVNGVRWRSPRLPEVPLVQPEKVVNVPLDLSFDKRYEYRLLGRDTAEGRECYRIAFRPIDKTLSLYEGTVWIDTETFAKVKTSAAQTNLEKPITSNTETNVFGSVVAPDGLDYWLLRRIEGQMVFTTAGRSTVLERKVVFSDFRVNAPDFEERRRASHESDHQMLRDTEKGFRYLTKDRETGERVVKEGETRDSLLLLGGAYYDASLDYPIPLAGVNYFSFDFHGTGTQVNLFYAGVLGTLNATRPSLFGTNLEASLDLFAIGVAARDRFFVNGVERRAERLKSRTASAELGLGLPFADYFKIRGTYEAAYERFKRDEATDPAFVLPENTLTHTGHLAVRYDRKGWNLEAWRALSHRGKWSAWGLPGNPGFDPQHKSYEKYGASLAKTFYLPKFHKISFALDGMAGSDLDRFSRYRLTFFGTRVRGFSGSGIRFGRGAVASLGWGFGLGEAVGFDAVVDVARTREPMTGEYMKHTGAGLGANFMGPKNTIINFEAAYGIRSDVEPAEGDFEARLVVLKLFDRGGR